MTTTCRRDVCNAPEIACDLGHVDLSKCPNWGERKGEGAQATDAPPEEHDTRFPWSGSALGLIDLGFVAGRSKPTVVGIVGPENAGKTTMLAAWYLLVGRGAHLGEMRFGGSYTLEGWEAVAHSLRWPPGGKPAFPPHTSSRSGRAPGLLHFALRDGAGYLHDFLFTDAPGEWFQRWAVNREAAEASGGRWVAEHADIFLFVADNEALSGPSMGSARGDLQLLANRLGAERGDRPVALVWSKGDIEIAPSMATTVRESVKRSVPDVQEFTVSVLDDGKSTNTGRGFLELLSWAIGSARRRTSLNPVQEATSDPFFAFGRV